MIKFERRDNKVIVKIEHGIFGNNGYFETNIQESYDYQAVLLRRQLEEQMYNRIKLIKEKYYNLGWKNAKGHTNKQKYFYGNWE